MDHSFWETVRGVELAEILKKTLPKISEQQDSADVLVEIKLLRKSVDELTELIRKKYH